MEHSCKHCGSVFVIHPEDLEFYEKVSPEFGGKKFLIPAPTLCPACRFQRRMIWRREHALYSRTCDQCKKNIVSIHSPDAKYPVFCLKCWWSDDWDPLQYGQKVDNASTFFEQYARLLPNVPQIAMMNDNGTGSENCEYCQDFGFSRNCYLVTGAWKLEDCYYCDCNCVRSKRLVDCISVQASELAYDCISSQNLNRCSRLHYCDNCHDCMYGFDLKGCSDCIACFGLRQQRFCIFNERYSEDEYKRKVKELQLDSHSGREELSKRFEEWILSFPRKAVCMINCENCTGDDLYNSKDCISCFQEDGAEYCKYCIHGDAVKNCYDVNSSGSPEWCLEDATPDNSYMTHFCTWCWKDKYVLYSDNCHNCEHCFGCVGLKRKKYCIFNMQYSKEEYERIVGSLIERMKMDGQWGEFFPMQLSPYAYNETLSNQDFPLAKEQALAEGLRWRDAEQKTFSPQRIALPETIQDIEDSVSEEILACQSCSKNYKILAQELQFYRDMDLPLPRNCYDCRYAIRFARHNPRRLWKRTCAHCSDPIETSYAPDRPEIVYCEKCYLETVY